MPLSKMAKKKPEQLNLDDKWNIFENEPKKMRWETYDGHRRTWVSETRKEHICSKCEKIIPLGSRVVVTIDFDGVKPTNDDFKKAKYWHPDPKLCEYPPAEIIEDEPL